MWEGGKSLGPSLGQDGARVGVCLISAGTALPTSFPSSKPGFEEPGGKPRGKHGLSSVGHCFPPPLAP